MRSGSAYTPCRVTYCRMNHPRQLDSKMPCLGGRLLNGDHQSRLELENWEMHKYGSSARRWMPTNTKQSTVVKGVKFINPGDPESRKSPSPHIVSTASKGGKSCSIRGGLNIMEASRARRDPQHWHIANSATEETNHSLRIFPQASCIQHCPGTQEDLFDRRGKNTRDSLFYLVLPLPAADSIFPTSNLWELTANNQVEERSCSERIRNSGTNDSSGPLYVI